MQQKVHFLSSHFVRLVGQIGTFLSIFSGLNSAFSFVATLGNIFIEYSRTLERFVCYACQFKEILLLLTISDLVVGLLPQPMLDVIAAVMPKEVANGNATADFNHLCPKILNVGYFFARARSSLLSPPLQLIGSWL